MGKVTYRGLVSSDQVRGPKIGIMLGGQLTKNMPPLSKKPRGGYPKLTPEDKQRVIEELR